MAATDRRSQLLKKLIDLEFKPDGFRLSFEVAGVRFDFLTQSAEMARQIDFCYSPYSSENERYGKPRAEIFVELESCKALWEDEDPEFDIRGKEVIQRDFAAKIISQDAEPVKRIVACLPTGLDDSLHNLLRWLMPCLLLEKNAFLLHGAGVVKNGEGFVFFGQSGAGKSTTVSLIRQVDPEVAVVGDDVVVLQMNGQGEPWMHTAPFGCGYSQLTPFPISAPLKNLYSLEQSSVNQLQLINKSEAIAALLASSMAVNFAENVDLKISLASEFAMRPGIQRLHFKKTGEFWEMILKKERNAKCPSQRNRPKTIRSVKENVSMRSPQFLAKI